MANTNVKKDLFENTPVPKALATVAVPTVISQLINLIYNIADTFYVGRTGDPYMIAAVSLAFTLFVMQIPIANLFGVGGGGLISRLLGQGQHDRAKAVSAFSFYGAIAFALLYALGMLIFLNPILYALGASDATIGYARQYMLLVVIIGAIPTILSQVLSHLLRNSGYSKQASLGLSGGGILNIILDPLFMFVIFPRDMAVFGAALATLVSNIASMIYFLITVNKVSKTTVLSLDFADAKRITGEDAKSTFSVGVPAAILPALYDLCNMFLNSHMAYHGDLQLAAIGIVLKVERLPNAIGLGISQGMLPLVGYNFSSGNHKRMNEIMNTARVYGLIITLATVALYEIFAGPITGIFISTANAGDASVALEYAKTFLRIRAVMAPFMFINYHTSYCMQAMGDGRGTLLHSIGRQLVFNIPLLFLFDYLWAENGLCLSIVVGEFLAGILAILLLRAWMKKVANEPKISYN